jgi:hypothetical protein
MRRVKLREFLAVVGISQDLAAVFDVGCGLVALPSALVATASQLLSEVAQLCGGKYPGEDFAILLVSWRKPIKGGLWAA